MEQYLSEILLAVLIGVGFPIIWKTNSLLTRLMHSSDKSAELLGEAIKSLRHNEKEHLEIVHTLENLRKDVLGALGEKR